jgi:branched-subunit amino acid transport protein
MNASYAWGAIILLMVMVLAMRWSFLLLPRRFQPRGVLAEALSYAPLAALMAICAPEMMKLQTDAIYAKQWAPDLLATDWRLWGGAAMLLVATLTRNSKKSALYGLVAAALTVWAF